MFVHTGAYTWLDFSLNTKPCIIHLCLLLSSFRLALLPCNSHEEAYSRAVYLTLICHADRHEQDKATYCQFGCTGAITVL